MALNIALPTTIKLNLWQKIGLILICLLVTDLTGLSTYLTRATAWTLLPARHVSVWTVSQTLAFWDNLGKLPKAAQRIQDLELRLAAASASLAELETLRRENTELRFLLTNTDRPNERTLIAAPVIAFARPAINLGSQAGAQPGAMVLSRGTLLGQVEKVEAYESTVRLLFEADSQPILARTDSGVQGLLIGDGKKMLLTQVVKDTTLTVGERVVTVGQPQIEQNIPVGRIVRVDNEPVSSVQSAVVEPYVSFFETPLVEVR